ncbi:MAG TPA: hypothetical protein DD490_07970 [Acidobacteria bacterium]|nr:hypothetical protein [Acidobacteriota bacterium]
MIQSAIVVFLLLMGIFAAALALLAARQNAAARKRLSGGSETLPEDVSGEDRKEFFRLLEDDAPGLLQHLAAFRGKCGGAGLRLLVEDFVDNAAGMPARKDLLRTLSRLYTTSAPTSQALHLTVAGMRPSGATETDVKTAELVREIERVSPTQVAVLRLLSSFLTVAEESRADRLPERLKPLKSLSPPPEGRGLDRDLVPVYSRLHELIVRLVRDLPRRGTRDKAMRRSALARSLEALHETVAAHAAGTPPWLRQLPEGLMAVHLFRVLSQRMNDLLKKSGGQEMELPPVLSEPAMDAGSRPGFSTLTPGVAGASVLALLLFSGAAAVQWMFNPHSFNLERTLENTVQITSDTGRGTGFFVQGESLIVTNEHVVGEDSVVEVLVKRKGQPEAPLRSLRARLLGRDATNDVAILTLEAPYSVDTVPSGLEMVHESGFQPGQAVHVVGNPIGIADTYLQGRVAKVEKDLAWIDVNIGPGNSGGPVCDENGRVVGIATAKTGRGGFSLGIATPTHAAWRLIDRIKSAPTP